MNPSAPELFSFVYLQIFISLLVTGRILVIEYLIHLLYMYKNIFNILSI